ncbi:MAG: radical SAM family heme chaperone HemW [Synergistaceae bacterium]|jgi:oxygen-independent coproporphyrinogen-3 oxidase|nr:radical SAM family heme chaperone HemW [Synergistaceae bacterium]
MNPRSLYVHVPFCESKCPYCAFASAVKRPGDEEAYLRSLMEEAASKSGIAEDALLTLYIGGGTPTALSPDAWHELTAIIGGTFRLAAGAEVTAEANPGTLSRGHAETWRGFVNRVSVGVQSFDDDELKFLGRAHDSGQAAEAVEMCVSAGFETSVDLMFGLPEDPRQDGRPKYRGQTLRGWAANLRRAVGLGAGHISAYQLTIEPGTPFSGLNFPKHALTDGYLPYRYAQWYLPRKGYVQYEVASFSKPGCESRHNLNYWADGEYIGLGPSAWSYVGGTRSQNARTLDEYARMTAEGKSASVYEESLPPAQAARQAAVLALRARDGIDWRSFGERHGNAMKDEIAEKLNIFPKSLLRNDSHRASLTAAGLRVANRVWEEMI